MLLCVALTTVCLTVGSVALAQDPTCTEPGPVHVSFNQLDIESWRTGMPRVSAAAVEPDTLEIDYDQPESVLRAVLSACPGRATVYPSERYYYFKLHLETATIWGNLRFTDAASGVLHLGYFYPEAASAYRFKTFGRADGVVVTSIGPHEWRVAAFDLEREFRIDREVVDSPPATELTRWEFHVTALTDESGTSFDLLYNRVLRSFLFVLREDNAPCEVYEHVTSEVGSYMVGCRTGFVFFDDQRINRRVLVAVLASNIARNNEYDGPFDQIPPDLDLGPLVEDVYPYVTGQGGVDLHGNFLALPGQRIAISPYQRYDRLDSLIAWLDRCFERAITRQDLWMQMTFENKRYAPAALRHAIGR